MCVCVCVLSCALSIVLLWFTRPRKLRNLYEITLLSVRAKELQDEATCMRLTRAGSCAFTADDMGNAVADASAAEGRLGAVLSVSSAWCLHGLNCFLP